MNKNNQKPKIKIDLTAFDYAAETFGLLCCTALIVLPLFYYNLLPEIIPRHFNFSGEADAWSEKWIIFTLPAIGTGLYLMMSIISRYPHTFNYMTAITEENAEIQYQTALRMVRLMKLIILLTFLYITMGTINTALGKTSGLGTAFLPVLLILILGIIIYYLTKSFKNK